MQESSDTINLLVRNSGKVQVGNYRSEVQFDMRARIESLGYTVRVFDEQGTSGKDLSARDEAMAALAEVANGETCGIGVLDIKRATRDEDAMDARTIKQVLRRARGILITRDKV
jgi:DNA invertase Pin-like site-specific DNA recombinase